MHACCIIHAQATQLPNARMQVPSTLLAGFKLQASGTMATILTCKTGFRDNGYCFHMQDSHAQMPLILDTCGCQCSEMHTGCRAHTAFHTPRCLATHTGHRVTYGSQCSQSLQHPLPFLHCHKASYHTTSHCAWLQS